MISRRRFLEVGGVAAGVAAVSHPLLASGPEQPETPDDSACRPLWRSVSRKNEAAPITREERRELAELGMSERKIAGQSATGSQTSAKEEMSQAGAPSTAEISGQNPKLVIPQILIVSPEEARVYSQGLGEAHILVGGERSGGAWWLGQFREDPGFMTLLHLHPHMDEYFFILQGVLSVYIDGTWHDLKAGAFALVPRGTPHAQGNTGKEPVHFVGSGSPAGFERFFIELDEIAKRVPPGPQFGAEIAKIMPKYDTEPLGPPPRRS
jgi:mannose-6-phosphate isomerase-like protein (cupin superfamily)